MISAIIITFNEENDITPCIKNLSWVDEIIVVNNNSTDSTKKIAETLGATVIDVANEDFSELRNSGAQKARYEWLLYVDVDERIPPDLQKEIVDLSSHFNSTEDPHAYVIKRSNIYLGHPWPYKDGMIRLIYKPSLIEWYGQLHESAKINGKVSTLLTPLIHTTHTNLEEMVFKTNKWSRIEARLRFDQQHPTIVPWRLFRVMVTGVYDSYIKQQGYKAGTHGVIESIYQAFSMFITYAKLWEMQQHSNNNTSTS